MGTVGQTSVILLVAMALVGCAQLKNVFSPPPPKLPPAKKEAITPPPSKPAPAPAAPATPPPAAKAPAPPAPAPPAPKEQVPVPQPSPPVVLSPQVGRTDEDRLKQESSGRIQKAEEIIKQIDQKKLNKDQMDTFSTIQSFLANAKEAITAQDYLRASNLAGKAQVLAEELFRALQ